MAKVYPQTATCSTYITSRRETFTIWMKSLVVHGNGCTVFDSNGEIVYRIDNYDKKCSNEVYLMDRQGKVLFTIQRKKLRVFGRWDGYKRSASKVNKEKPWFQVRKNFNVFEENLTCQVTVGYTKAKACCYRMEGLAGKLAFKIIDSDGDLIAEAKLFLSDMAKVHPLSPISSSSSSSERETFTIWMKSLVLRGNGCTVYNSNGEIVYRIDNYDSKCSNEVYLMNLSGKVLCTILRKKWASRSWDGHKCNGPPKVKNEKPWFQVRKNCKTLKGGDSAYLAMVGCDRAQSSCYRIEGSPSKSAFKIMDSEQGLVAEVMRKQSSSGVMLGDDVLSLVVEPHIDHSLIMALVAVYGLIGHKM
ncbi:hypothetical protein L1049_006651 [Liquidambar formosana]|uniref:Uncharacterized protein n=1 Tax=Liquidambar formosana TaxID=63359 RepID=A0AAP0RHB8_LIQFO